MTRATVYSRRYCPAVNGIRIIKSLKEQYIRNVFREYSHTLNACQPYANFHLLRVNWLNIHGWLCAGSRIAGLSRFWCLLSRILEFFFHDNRNAKICSDKALPNVFRVSVIDDQHRCPLMLDNLSNSLQRARKTSEIVLYLARRA